jgi:hypothetical protein
METSADQADESLPGPEKRKRGLRWIARLMIAMQRSTSSIRMAAPIIPLLDRKPLLGKRRQAIRAKDDPSTQRLGRIVGLAQWACVIYASFVLLPASTSGQGFAIGAAEYGSNKGPVLCPRASICSEGWLELVLIATARLSAYYMLPSMVVVFLSKCKGMNTALEMTLVSLWVPLSDLHTLHSRFVVGSK